MVPATYFTRVHQAADLMESVIRAHPRLLQADGPWALFDYDGSEPLRRFDLTSGQASLAFYKAKRRVNKDRR